MPNACLTLCLTLDEDRARATIYGARDSSRRQRLQHAAEVRDIIRSMKVRLIILTTVKALPANKG